MGKGIQYWENEWNKYTSGTQSDLLHASERILDHYAELWNTTHGKIVRSKLYAYGYHVKNKILHTTIRTPDDIVNEIHKEIGQHPIKKNGDLHQILKVMGIKVHGNKNHYLDKFNVNVEKSFGDYFRSLFFCCYTSNGRKRKHEHEKTELIREKVQGALHYHRRH